LSDIINDTFCFVFTISKNLKAKKNDIVFDSNVKKTQKKNINIQTFDNISSPPPLLWNSCNPADFAPKLLHKKHNVLFIYTIQNKEKSN